MRVSEMALQYLSRNNLTTAFGVPCATIAPLVDSFNSIKGMEYIITKCESSASYSACKYAKVTGKAGLLIVSGSVGLGNSMNGIAEASMAKLPMVVISGYVATDKQGLGEPQETEGENYIANFSKYSTVIKQPIQLIQELERALKIAYEYPRGVVHIGIPLDVQMQECSDIPLNKIPRQKIHIDYKALRNAVLIIGSSNKGLLLVGGGCRGLSSKITKLAELLQFDIITTPSGKGIVSELNPRNLGYFGLDGTDTAKHALLTKDYECIVALGTRLGGVSTQNYTSLLNKGKLIHIDADATVFNKAYKADIEVIGELSGILDFMLDNEFVPRKPILPDIPVIKNKPIKQHEGLWFRDIANCITKFFPSNTFYSLDIGSHMIAALKRFIVPCEGDFECNLNYGAMCTSTGCMGISRAFPDRKVVQLIGDGGLLMQGFGELLTYKKYNMNITTIVVNNSSLRFVEEGHKNLFRRCIKGFRDEEVNLSKLAEVLGIPSIRVTSQHDIPSLKRFIEDTKDRQSFIEIVSDSSEPVSQDRFKLLKNNMQ